MAQVALGAAAEWDVLGTPAVQTTTLSAGARWDVLGAPAAVVLTAGARWNVRGTTTLSAEASWNVVAANPVRLLAGAGWNVKSLVRLTGAAEWTVERRPEDVSTFCQLNGINLNVVEFDPGDEPQVFDKMEHHDGSIGLHNMRPDIFDRRVRVKCRGTSHTDLDGQEDAIKAACMAGGTIAWQSVDAGGAVGPMHSDAFAPSDAPSFVRDKTREALYRSYATLVLRMWPA
jgi:hypothetical protein